MLLYNNYNIHIVHGVSPEVVLIYYFWAAQSANRGDYFLVFASRERNLEVILNYNWTMMRSNKLIRTIFTREALRFDVFINKKKGAPHEQQNPRFYAREIIRDLAAG